MTINSNSYHSDPHLSTHSASQTPIAITTTSMAPEIIVYGYDLAPNPQKLTQFLAFFKIPYKFVDLPVILPRPMMAEIGITYRRTPLLSIGSDMYVDNSLAIEKLADMARHSKDNGLEDATNHVEYDGMGQQAFQCAVGLLPGDMSFLQDPKFLEDRSELSGRSFKKSDLEAIRPMMISKMLSVVGIVESHFLSTAGVERKFFLGGKMPTTADLHLYWGLNWGLRFHKGARPEISETTHPMIFKWLDDVEEFLKGRKDETRIEIKEAYEVLKVPPKHEYAKFVPHMEDNPEKLSVDQRVKVTPADTGRNHPQFGKLISLNSEQVCLRNDKDLVMHFPRLGYEIAAA